MVIFILSSCFVDKIRVYDCMPSSTSVIVSIYVSVLVCGWRRSDRKIIDSFKEKRKEIEVVIDSCDSAIQCFQRLSQAT